MDIIFNQIEILATLSGNLLKDGVRIALEEPYMRRYFTAVLDPAITYGVAGKLTGGEGVHAWGVRAHRLLDQLAARELTGSAAKEALAIFACIHTPETVQLMNRALNKDLRCGVGITLINSLGIDFRIPVFTCQLAQPFEAKRMAGSSWCAAIKYDGMRALAVIDDNRVEFLSRSGKPIPALQPLRRDVLDVFGGCRVVVDCEGIGSEFLDSISNLRRTKNIASISSSIILQCFDILPLDEFQMGKDREPIGQILKVRLGNLAARFAFGSPESVQMVKHVPLTGTEEDACAIADGWISEGLEGAIIKRYESRYVKARTYDWMKIKVEDAITAVITGIVEGEAGKQFEGMMGAVTVEVDGVQSRVGMGWTSYERAAIWAAFTGLVVADVVPKVENIVIGRLIDITHNGKMPSGALRHARKTRFRDLDGSHGVIA